MKQKPQTTSRSNTRRPSVANESRKPGVGDRRRPTRTGLRDRAEARLRKVGVHPESQPILAELYSRAEARLRQQQTSRRVKDKTPEPATPEPVADPMRLLHELQVHQVELEMQNTELQKARDELERVLERYTDLYDLAPVGYFSLARSGVIQQVNLTGARLVGIDRSALAGRTFDSLIAAGLRPAFHNFLERVFADQPKQTADFDLPDKGRACRAVNLEAQRSVNGQECRVVVVDISERKRVEDQVRVSEIRYRRLFEAAQDGVLLIDPDTRKITDANPFMTQLLGYPNAELVGKELFEIGLLKDELASQEMFRKLKRNHEVRYEDLPLENQKGRHQEVEVVASLYQENGHAVIQCNIRDITERKRAEEVHARLAAIVESSEDAIISKDLNGLITSWNAGAEHLFGYTAKEAIGRSTSMLIPRNRVGEEPDILGRIRRGERVKNYETVRRRKDGKLLDVSLTVSPILDSSGQTIGASKIAHDITERKRAEETQRRIAVLDASNRKLEKEIVRRKAVEKSLKQSERQQRHLLSESRRMQEQLRHLSRRILQAQEEERKRISRELHDDITQTLVNINVHLQSLVRELDINPRQVRQKIIRTQQLVERSVDIVHQFARDLRPPALDHLGLISALHSLMTDFMKRTGIRVHFTTFAAVEQLNSNRRTVLYRVAQSALANVAQHSQASRVDVNIRKLDHRVCLTIKDNGKSFDVERLRQRKGRRPLGLLGMNERLEMVGGSFEVKSSPGKGTTIRAQIPLARSAPARGAGGWDPCVSGKTNRGSAPTGGGAWKIEQVINQTLIP